MDEKRQPLPVCPLLLARPRERGRDDWEEAECVGAQCAWWIRAPGRCAITHFALQAESIGYRE